MDAAIAGAISMDKDVNVVQIQLNDPTAFTAAGSVYYPAFCSYSTFANIQVLDGIVSSWLEWKLQAGLTTSRLLPETGFKLHLCDFKDLVEPNLDLC